MNFLRLFFILLVLFLASCKPKKAIIATHPTPRKTEKTDNKVVSVEEKKSEERELKKPSEESKLETKISSNKTLTTFIVDWQGVVYKYGGNDKSGIDCSHFAAKLYIDVYDKKIMGAANTIEPLTTLVKITEMQEGDLVFFKIESNKVSHVGVYIGNNKFVHASTKRGVIISDLNETYYKKYFYKAGRLK